MQFHFQTNFVFIDCWVWISTDVSKIDSNVFSLAFRPVPTVNHHTKAMLHARQILRMKNKRSNFCEGFSIVSVLFEFSSLSKGQMFRMAECFDDIYELPHHVAQSQHGRRGWEWMTVYCWAHGGKSCVCLPGLSWAKSLESVCNEHYANWFKPESMLSPSIQEHM